jgi:hypothetical protein
MDVDSPVALALRALQKLDEVQGLDGATVNVAGKHRYLIIEAQSHLGEALGLECTGAPDGTNEDGTVAYYSHDGDTCPIHEWLVDSDSVNA